MKRELMLRTIIDVKPEFDIIIIGGGATGLGCAVDSATRGFKTLLIEQSDFAKGTSSRSTKLVHGGVRYLQKGDVSLVLEALHERGLLLHNAPHLVRNQSFIIPNYEWWEGPFYTIGMKVYDMMAGKLGLGPSEHLSKEEVLKEIPNLKTEGLQGGVIYHDGQFDDSRLAINLAQSCVENGGTVLNYCKCKSLLKSASGIIEGVVVEDIENNKEYSLYSKVVINATGVWADDIIRMDNVNAKKTIVPSQGIHLVLNKDFLLGNDAIMIPHTEDGRVLFAVPWHDKVILGTTDTPVKNAELEPKALKEEIDFILKTASIYLTKAPTKKDIKSIFAGLRPLAAPIEDEKSTKEISRSHKLIVSVNGLLTITGGKWTTYRKMAEDAIDKAILIGGLKDIHCKTKNMPIHGAVLNFEEKDHLHIYGSDKVALLELMTQRPELKEKISPLLPYTKAEVIWAIQHEMAQTLEDVLARRTRALFLDAAASIEIAEKVAELMKIEMHKDEVWKKNQVEEYCKLAKNYLPE